ncbi:hypothetical protein [Ruegeria sp. HKCCD7559]|uniref:hypothetical protein n=1 Tax=Ruegeria sp. HKCCD7559 TaxID=2683005 RepID=UPI00149247E1|nr:hypothetical protein [Ruegeria sp. HKCCD7559]NOC44140.1 hypothetical protein [Ruegeria sp. HKCCD7559]
MTMSKSDRWTLGVAVASALIATCGTGFAGYQTYLTREALISSKTAGLQGKQIDYCERLIVAAGSFGSIYEAESVTRSKRNFLLDEFETIDANGGKDTSVGSQVPAIQSAPGDVASSISEELTRHLGGELASASSDLRNAVDLLAVYSQPETVQQLDNIKAKSFLVVMLMAADKAMQNSDPETKVEYVGGTPEEHLADLRKSIENVKQKCTKAMLGSAQEPI